MLGVDKPGAQLSFSSAEILVDGKTLTGCLFGGLKPKSDIPMLVKRYMDKVFEKKIKKSIRFYFPNFHFPSEIDCNFPRALLSAAKFNFIYSFFGNKPYISELSGAGTG